MTSPIYTDNGARHGRRTRYFRDAGAGSGVEWIFAVDHAAGSDRWYAFLALPGATIAGLIDEGMTLTRHKEPTQ